jgi:hypothetical protein
MTKFLSSLLLASLVASAYGFTPAYPHNGASSPFFITVVKKDVVKADKGSFASADSIVMDQPVIESKPKAVNKPAAKGHGKEGPIPTRDFDKESHRRQESQQGLRKGDWSSLSSDRQLC